MGIRVDSPKKGPAGPFLLCVARDGAPFDALRGLYLSPCAVIFGRTDFGEGLRVLKLGDLMEANGDCGRERSRCKDSSQSYGPYGGKQSGKGSGTGCVPMVVPPQQP